jgi:hypothetical protein
MGLRQGNINDVITILRDNRDNDFFNCLALTGKVRRGKSRLGYILTTGVYDNFSYEENYIGNPKHGEAFKKMFNSPNKSAVWVDEAEKILSSERRMDKEQWWLQQLFNQFASHNKTIILCTPQFRRIDSRWRDTHIGIWIHVYRRGCAVLLKNRDIQSTLDVWGLETMKEVELTTRADGFSDERILKNFDANPCALFYFTFPDWDGEAQKAEYMKHKTVSQADLLDEFSKWEKLNERDKKIPKSTQALARVITYLNFKYEIPFKELATLAGTAPDYMSDLQKKFISDVVSTDALRELLPRKYFGDDFLEFAKLSDADIVGV